MDQLPGADAIFLAMETPTQHMHIGALTIVDPSGAEGFGFERMRELLEERIHLAPKFKKKLREVPLGLARPFWVDDPDFDVGYHMHRVAVPSPSTDIDLVPDPWYIAEGIPLALEELRSAAGLKA